MSSVEESSSQSFSWIEWYCGLEDHDFYCKVDREYIEDPFNLYGLKKNFLNYDEALQMIINDDIPTSKDHDDQNYMNVYQEAVDLYGMVHARYILTQKGL
jgi:casein kinase II subunit beta